MAGRIIRSIYEKSVEAPVQPEEKGTRLSFSGDFFSDNVHIVERIAFVDANTMNYEATIEDPTVFTRPWTMRVIEKRRPDEEPWESACWEGNVPPDTWLLKPDAEHK